MDVEVESCISEQRPPGSSAKTELAPYQQDAVSEILATLVARPGVLLADAVGLGKSFVAAEVMRELTSNGWSCEIIVPHSLLTQWSEVLTNFDLSPSLESHEALPGRPVIPFTADRQLVVVDEAHRFRNPGRKRFRALAMRVIGKKVLLITATPICNSVRDLGALLSLFAPDDLLRAVGAPSMREAFERHDRKAIAVVQRELIVRRGREVLPRGLQFARLDREVLRFSIAAADRLSALVRSLQFPLLNHSWPTGLMRSFLWRRLESSEAALIQSVMRQARFYRRARESLLDGFILSRRDYRAIFGDDRDELEFQDVLFRELWSAPATVRPEDLRDVDHHLDTLGRIVTEAQRSASEKPAILERCLSSPGMLPALVFTGAVATALTLYERLSGLRCGLVTSRTARLSGARKSDPESVFASFRSGALDVLVVTDLASEGLNLQQAGAVIHYDLAWTAVRLEQREGRSNRIGQTRASVRSVYFVPDRLRNGSAMIQAILQKARLTRTHLDSALPPETPARDATRLAETLFAPRLLNVAPREALMRLSASFPEPDVLFEDLLTFPYRAGAEFLIEEMSREFFDATRRKYLKEVLLNERLGSDRGYRGTATSLV